MTPCHLRDRHECSVESCSLHCADTKVRQHQHLKTVVPICLMTGCHNPEDTILYSHHCKKPQISNSTYSIYSIDGNHPQYPEMKHSINFTKSAICTVHATSHVNLCCDLRLCFLQILRICVQPITGRKTLVRKHYEQVYFLLQP